MVQSPITYKQLVAQSDQLKGDLSRLATDSVATARERATWLSDTAREQTTWLSETAREQTNRLSQTARERTTRASQTARERATWLFQTWAALVFTVFYWAVVVPTTWAYAFATDTILALIAHLAPKTEILRVVAEIFLSVLSALQRSVCWIFAYVRHREKTAQCTVKYLKENEIEVYGFVAPQKANAVLLKYFPIVNDAVAPAVEFILDLILSVRPDNCGQLDHKNDRHECWVLDEGKLSVLPTRSNCPVAQSSHLHRRIQTARVDLAKLASNVAVASAA